MASLRETACEFLEQPRMPFITSFCSGTVCYVERKQPALVPSLSRLRSPEQLFGNYAKRAISTEKSIPEESIFHVCVVECHDKKLESAKKNVVRKDGVRLIDCVLTAKGIGLFLETGPCSSSKDEAASENDDVERPGEESLPRYIDVASEMARERLFPFGRLVESESSGKSTEISIVDESGCVQMRFLRVCGFSNVHRVLQTQRSKYDFIEATTFLRPGVGGSVPHRVCTQNYAPSDKGAVSSFEDCAPYLQIGPVSISGDALATGTLQDGIGCRSSGWSTPELFLEHEARKISLVEW
ncbi:MAG: uncharacterized protein A8A55_1002 [Amphiamblys sp. WSBS2006]|nr:MAG: uncharacterized protein A8A55_1002 [Amphiamblys sp. WSBS2006]